MAQALLDGESAGDFTWALTCLKEMGAGVEPLSIFTDADLGAECAMNRVFPGSDKYRCVVCVACLLCVCVCRVCHVRPCVCLEC